MRSPSRRISAARANPVMEPHSPSSAPRAADTAASTSSGPPSGISAQSCPVYGFCERNVFPDSAPTGLPPISIENFSNSAMPRPYDSVVPVTMSAGALPPA